MTVITQLLYLLLLHYRAEKQIHPYLLYDLLREQNLEEKMSDLC